MSGDAAYLDTSAFLKLVVREAESSALRAFLGAWRQHTSALLLRIEAVRALRRAGYDDRIGDARRLMRAMTLIRLDETLVDHAAELDPREMRSLDAVHLGAALSVAPDLGVFVTYDTRLAAAAHAVGLVVRAPR